LEKASSQLITFSGYPGLNIVATGNYIRGGNQTQIAFSGGYYTLNNQSSACLFENLAYCFGNPSSANVLFPTVAWTCMGTFVNCGVVCYIKGTMRILDSQSNLPGSPLTSSGNTTFVLIDRDARVQIGSNIPSGLAVTDISVAGATSTLAAMRALTPKVFPGTPNAYGSYVYE
jgi:hypothetical protein